MVIMLYSCGVRSGKVFLLVRIIEGHTEHTFCQCCFSTELKQLIKHDGLVSTVGNGVRNSS